MAFFDLTNGPDNITLAPGQAAGAFVRGLDGNDTIRGSLDPEDINGNRGNDSIFGGVGNDFMRGGQEDDIVFGDEGNDTVNGNFGNDQSFGNDGDDIVRGGQGNDFASGGKGNDFLYGDLGTDSLFGDEDNDVFVLRTDTAVANSLLTDIIFDFSLGGALGADLIGLTGGLTETGISLVPGGGTLGFTAADTFIRLGTTGDFLGVVLGRTPGELAGRFTSAPD